MKIKPKPSLEDFEIFKSEKEKPLAKWIFVGNLFFLISALVVQFVYQEIFEINIISWYHFWILFFGNILVFTLIFIFWQKNYKVWILKYMFVIFGIFLLASWIYLTDPKYTRSMFASFLLIIAIAGGLFYEINLAILATLVGALSYGAILLHYSNIGVLPPFYELYFNFLFFVLTLLFTFIIVQRTRLYLIELFEKRKELEEAKSVLEVKVKARTRELEELTKSLDQKVQERTKQLQERVNQLERFQQLTIGRELKMVELKKKIKELETELKSFKPEEKKDE